MQGRLKTWRPSSALALSALFFAFFTTMLVTGLRYPHQARLFPTTMMSVASLLALTQVVSDLRGRGTDVSSRGVDLQADDDLGLGRAARVAAPHFAAIFLLAGGTFLLGPLIPIGAFVTGYVRVLGRRSWRFSVGLALGVMLGLIVVFSVLVSTTWPRGVITGPQRFLLGMFDVLR